MKQLEVCYVNGNGMLAHFSDAEYADELMAMILENYKNAVEEGTLPPPVHFQADDASGILHFQEICFIKMTDVETHAILANSVGEILEEPPKRH